jgi:hypothetical protein
MGLKNSQDRISEDKAALLLAEEALKDRNEYMWLWITLGVLIIAWFAYKKYVKR